MNFYSYNNNEFKQCFNQSQYDLWTFLYSCYGLTRIFLCLYNKTKKKILMPRNHFTSPLEWNVFWCIIKQKKVSRYMKKIGSQWVRDLENMVNVAVSYLKSVSFCSVILATSGQDLSWSKIGPHRLTSSSCISTLLKICIPTSETNIVLSDYWWILVLYRY